MHSPDAPQIAPSLPGRRAAVRGSFAMFATAVIAVTAWSSGAVAATLAPKFSAGQITRVDRLLKLIQDRLDMAPAIAETRWKTMSRIEDHASEQTLIDAVRKQSAILRIDAALATDFAQAQIDAGKIIQTARHKGWAAEPTRAPNKIEVANPMVASTLEPELGVPLLKAFRDALAVLRRQGSRELLNSRAADLIHVGGPDLLAAQAALKPLYAIAR